MQFRFDTGIFTGQSEFVPSVETGKTILEWCNGEGKIVQLNPQNSFQNDSLSDFNSSISCCCRFTFELPKTEPMSTSFIILDSFPIHFSKISLSMLFYG